MNTLFIDTSYKGEATPKLIRKGLRSSLRTIKKFSTNVNWETLSVKVDEETFPKPVTVIVVSVQADPR